MFFVADPSGLSAGIVHAFLLLGNLLIHRFDRTAHDLLFLFHARVLINIDNFISDVGRLLGVGVEHADLKQIGVAHFIDFELTPEPLVSLFQRDSATAASPFSLQF